MKKRAKVSGARAKTRRTKASLGPEVTSRSQLLPVGDEAEVVRLTRELNEAQDERRAALEVLQVISSSLGDFERVLATILEKAVRICGAKFGNVYLWDGEALRVAASNNTPSDYAAVTRMAFRPNVDKSAVGHMIANKAVVQIADMRVGQNYLAGDPRAVAAVELGGVRTLLAVPMLKENDLVGAFVLSRQEVRPFTEKQVELVQNFAAQAVIAIENARLLNELRQSNADLAGALEQQTATSDVLQVISRSPGELEPVFATMLEKAIGICDAKFGSLFRFDGEKLRPAAQVGAPSELLEAQKQQGGPPPGSLLDQVMRTKQVKHTADAAADPFPGLAAKFAGARSIVGVPMLKDDVLIGAILIYRQEVRPFTDKEIALLTNFAAQAVIAIENARLLNELRESLEQQTGTSEVLGVISRSPGELSLVFDTILANATRLCEAKFGILSLHEGNGLFSVRAMYNVPPAYAEIVAERQRRRTEPGFRPSSSGLLARSMTTKRCVHSLDLAEEPFYKERDPIAVAMVELGGARTVVLVPMLKDAELIGFLTIYRQEVRAFTAKQVELVQNFAAQAVIAIENARLLKELRERTEEVEKLNHHLEQRVADQVGEIERMGRLRRFLPPQVADLIVASGNEKQLESHRREITALFCDLRGFTGFSESSDPEDVMALLRDYHAAIGQIVVKYNGTLERYAGDGVMVIFNDPVPVENPALQAVLMALEVRHAIGSLTETWRRWGHDIGFGIGIAHGFATLGTIGFEGRFDYAAIGTVSNVASRLCDEAKPGQILISPRVLTKVEDAVKVEPVGEFELKGIRRPLAAYNVLSALA
jgi:GAF domain-containing protein